MELRTFLEKRMNGNHMVYRLLNTIEWTNLYPIYFSCMILTEYGLGLLGRSTTFLLLMSAERFLRKLYAHFSCLAQVAAECGLGCVEIKC